MLPNGLEISVRDNYRGSEPSIGTMPDILHFHNDSLEKMAEDSAITNIVRLSEFIPIDGGALG